MFDNRLDDNFRGGNTSLKVCPHSITDLRGELQGSNLDPPVVRAEIGVGSRDDKVGAGSREGQRIGAELKQKGGDLSTISQVANLYKQKDTF